MLRIKILACCLALSFVANCWQMPFVSAQSKNDSEDVKLTTKDGVRLKATFYPSSMGKEAVPIVILHDFKGSRKVFNGLAQELQSTSEEGRPSLAVLTVDLRGHGDSTVAEGPGGRTRELEAAKLGKQDFRNMVLFDMEAVRKFLVKQNDLGQLNLNKLCLMGAGLGANVATSWAAVDWSAPALASRKQGQDVKALILASPQWSHRGLPLLKPLRQEGLREQVSVLIFYGKEDRKATKDAQNIHKNLEKYHPLPPREERSEKQDLFLFGLPTSLQGTRLIATPDFGTLPFIEQFIDARVSQQEFDWIQRRRSN